MLKVLCYTGKGFNTYWVDSCEANPQHHAISMWPDIPPNLPPGTYTCTGAVYTPIRFNR